MKNLMKSNQERMKRFKEKSDDLKNKNAERLRERIELRRKRMTDFDYKRHDPETDEVQ